jgi:hypothetical protein
MRSAASLATRPLESNKKGDRQHAGNQERNKELGAVPKAWGVTSYCLARGAARQPHAAHRAPFHCIRRQSVFCRREPAVPLDLCILLNLAVFRVRKVVVRISQDDVIEKAGPQNLRTGSKVFGDFVVISARLGVTADVHTLTSELAVTPKLSLLRLPVLPQSRCKTRLHPCHRVALDQLSNCTRESIHTRILG